MNFNQPEINIYKKMIADYEEYLKKVEEWTKDEVFIKSQMIHNALNSLLANIKLRIEVDKLMLKKLENESYRTLEFIHPARPSPFVDPNKRIEPVYDPNLFN